MRVYRKSLGSIQVERATYRAGPGVPEGPRCRASSTVRKSEHATRTRRQLDIPVGALTAQAGCIRTPFVTFTLETIGLEKRFDELAVTRDLSLRIEAGARHALIGPNGAGKTTVINLLTGVLRPSAGRILLEGADITALPVHARVQRGLSRTFQINQLYADLTPWETIGLAVSERLGHGGDWWRRLGTRADVNGEIEESLARFHLLDVMNEPTARLPYGKQRLLEIALAIAARPRVLLLDEPAAGVPASERRDILAAVASLPREVTVLLIEHDMDLVFSFADRISVLVGGALLVEGTPGDVARDPRVRAVYLGEGATR